MTQPIIRTGILYTPALDLEAGAALRRALQEAGVAASSAPAPTPSTARFVVVHENYVAADRNWTEDVLCRWCDEEELDLILTVGGTMPAPGPSRRELMPDATQAVLDRALPGLPEAMRAHAGELTELALLDRGVAGIRSRTLLINLPAGGGPATLFLEAVLHLIDPILAHVREDAHAPQLVDEVELVDRDDDEGADEVEAGPEGASTARDTPGSAGKLDPAEFAEFLRRRKSQ